MLSPKSVARWQRESIVFVIGTMQRISVLFTASFSWLYRSVESTASLRAGAALDLADLGSLCQSRQSNEIPPSWLQQQRHFYDHRMVWPYSSCSFLFLLFFCNLGLSWRLPTILPPQTAAGGPFQRWRMMQANPWRLRRIRIRHTLPSGPRTGWFCIIGPNHSAHRR